MNAPNAPESPEGAAAGSSAPTLLVLLVVVPSDAVLSYYLYQIAHYPPVAQFLGLPAKLAASFIAGLVAGKAGGQSPVLPLTIAQAIPAYWIAEKLAPFTYGNVLHLAVGSILWVLGVYLGSGLGFFAGRRWQTRSARTRPGKSARAD